MAIIIRESYLMPSSRRIILALLGAAAFVFVAQPLPSWAEPTKDFPLCIQACNNARALCNEQCKDTCKSFFPNDQQAEKNCTDSCQSDCAVQGDECKAECLAIKDGGSPPSP